MPRTPKYRSRSVGGGARRGMISFTIPADKSRLRNLGKITTSGLLSRSRCLDEPFTWSMSSFSTHDNLKNKSIRLSRVSNVQPVISNCVGRWNGMRSKTSDARGQCIKLRDLNDGAIESSWNKFNNQSKGSMARGYSRWKMRCSYLNQECRENLAADIQCNSPNR